MGMIPTPAGAKIEQWVRHEDGSAGDANYGLIGTGYVCYRRPERRIAAFILEALGEATSILDVGAGVGSYEPTDRVVTAVEPSASMRAQRPRHSPQAIDAVAEHLPFPDKHFDASMATFSVNQWTDHELGLREMRRVTRGPVLILSRDPDELDRFWLTEYGPDVIATEARRYPAIASIAAALGPRTAIDAVPIPLDCVDGLNEAYCGRPERLLDPRVPLSCSAWGFVSSLAVERFVKTLGRNLGDGVWDARHGHLRSQLEFKGSLKLAVGHA
jgi:SAM-dependent methyltransferase